MSTLKIKQGNNWIDIPALVGPPGEPTQEQITEWFEAHPEAIDGIVNEIPVEAGSAAGSVKTKDFYQDSTLRHQTASGRAAFAEGQDTVASGVISHAEGRETIASGQCAHAEGRETVASSSMSHAEGYATKAAGTQSHSEGYKSVSTGNYSHAEGFRTFADGVCTHSEGTYSLAHGECAHAEGTGAYLNVVSFTGAENATTYTYTVQSSYNVTPEVGQYVVYGNNYARINSVDTANTTVTLSNTLGAAINADKVSILLGWAAGNTSHVEGEATIAEGNNQHVQGKYNVKDTSNTYADIVGNGTAYNARSNAYTLDWNGNGRYKGDVYVGCNSDSTGGEKLVKSSESPLEPGTGAGSVKVKDFTIMDTSFVNVASGNASFASGGGTVASAYGAHAEGIQTQATGIVAHAEGSQTIASGNYSHAEGNGTSALKAYSHAEGYNTITSGLYSHAEGGSSVAYGESSHAEGIRSLSYGASSHAEGQGNEFDVTITGQSGSAIFTYTVAAGKTISVGDIIIAENKAATINAVDTANTQITLSSAITLSSYENVSARIYKTYAYGDNSHVEGLNNIARGSSSHAEGQGTTASGNRSHAEGYSSIASGGASHAEGFSTQATKAYSHAEGAETIAYANCSHAEGYATVTSGMGSHSEGNNTRATGSYSHVSGTFNVQDSYSNWSEWVASTSYSVGDKVKVTTVSNNETTVSGYICKTANSDASFTAANWTDQNGIMNFAEIIGNGSEENARSNARTLDWSGNEYLAGDIYVGCNANSSGGTKLVNGLKVVRLI